MASLIDSETRIGTVSLSVGDLDRSLAYYIEIYRDRPRSMWHDSEGKFRMDSLPLDIDDILSVLDGDPSAWTGLPSGTDMGHIHLQVADVPAAESFYVNALGFERMIGMPSASKEGWQLSDPSHNPLLLRL